ncbi:MAG: DNA replication/repair protein RecF [Acidimicrobiia bacterium]|nr:DNA replication/repair protein RecF [Acidimicrobiia bacterium]NNL68390.1 DNA replication/repair protein RecF [Acidimicrobiia bacterium]
MRLETVELQSFRSYPHLEFVPDPGTNLLIGDNGAGKTNLLEAIAYLSTLRSFRKAPDDALIASSADGAIVRGAVGAPVSNHTIEIELSRAGRRRVLLDGKRPTRNAELRSRLRCVTFLPDDLELAKGSAGQRRNLLDDIASQLRVTAGADQADLERSLRQRNALLRNHGPTADPDALASFEDAIAEAGSKVVAARHETATRLGPYLQDAYGTLADNRVEWSYESRWGDWEDEPAVLRSKLADALAGARRKDMERRVTTVGPQRDEPRLFLDDRDSRTHASQGEQRSLVLALRLATFDLLAGTFDEPPVLLLDDVFSELDPHRAEAVVDRLPIAQAFLTSARHGEVNAVNGARWTVDPAGKVVMA